MLLAIALEAFLDWGDIVGEPLDSCEVARAQKLEIDYFRHPHTCGKVWIQEAVRLAPCSWRQVGNHHPVEAPVLRNMSGESR